MKPAIACQRKRRYRLKVHAETAALARMNAPRRRAKVPIYVYHCPECEGWHLTKRQQKVDET